MTGETTEHEYSVTVPRMYAEPSTEPEVTIGISAHGGGTVGRAYADNGWDYSVISDGMELISGSDLRSGGMGATHADMARTLASFLSADSETLVMTERGQWAEDPGRLSQYGEPARAFLETEGERLGLFADPEPEPADLGDNGPGPAAEADYVPCYHHHGGPLPCPDQASDAHCGAFHTCPEPEAGA